MSFHGDPPAEEFHPGLEGVLDVLRERGCGRVQVRWTENRSVYLSLRPRGTGWVLGVDRALREAPLGVWEAVGTYLHSGERRWLGPAREFFRSRRPSERNAGAGTQLRPQGVVHDLRPILEEVRRRGPLGDTPPVGITWGRRVKPGLRSVRLGTYRRGQPAVVSVHALLDHADVPRYVVDHIVHHEMIHHYLTVARGVEEGRRHGRLFRQLEEASPSRQRAREWEDGHLFRLVRAARRRRRGPGR